MQAIALTNAIASTKWLVIGFQLHVTLRLFMQYCNTEREREDYEKTQQ